MNAIITVIGKDNVGIIASISTKLAEFNINILDVNQTIMHGNFTMFMIVSLEKCNCEFNKLIDSFAKLSENLNLSIKIQREEIFNSMHTI